MTKRARTELKKEVDASFMNSLLLCLVSVDDGDLLYDDDAECIAGIKKLVEMGADVNAQDPSGKSVLARAASTIGPKPKTIQYLIDVGADNEYVNHKGYTPLMYAVVEFDKDATKYDAVNALLVNGTKINARNKNGETALHLAVKTSNLGLVELLLGHDADVFSENCYGLTPLECCSTGKDASIEQIRIASRLISDMKLLKEAEASVERMLDFE